MFVVVLITAAVVASAYLFGRHGLRFQFALRNLPSPNPPWVWDAVMLFMRAGKIVFGEETALNSHAVLLFFVILDDAGRIEYGSSLLHRCFDATLNLGSF
jgi:hypothetical protein